jgi:Holliday junction DNA helicase RuvA
MIAHLKGTLIKKAPQSIIVETGGIGYEVFTPLSTFYAIPGTDEQISLHIHTHVREDSLILFGFQTTLEKEIFRLLISVSGIGPKLAINILSGMGPDELLSAIARGDAGRLQSIPGVGKKTAERMALELKDKAGKISSFLELPSAHAASDEARRAMDDAVSALLNLGYQAKAANPAVEKALSLVKEINLEAIIKEALKLLA